MSEPTPPGLTQWKATSYPSWAKKTEIFYSYGFSLKRHQRNRFCGYVDPKFWLCIKIIDIIIYIYTSNSCRQRTFIGSTSLCYPVSLGFSIIGFWNTFGSHLFFWMLHSLPLEYGCRIVFGFVCLGFWIFFVFFPGTICFYLQKFGTRTCHFAWYLPHLGMVTLHFAWYLLHVAMHRSRKAEKQKSIEPGTPKKIQNLPQKK